MKLNEVLIESEFDDEELTSQDEMKYADTRLKIISQIEKKCGREFSNLLYGTTSEPKLLTLTKINAPIGPNNFGPIFPSHFVSYFYDGGSRNKEAHLANNINIDDPRLVKFKKLDKQLVALTPDGQKTIIKLKSMKTRAEKHFTIDSLRKNKQENDFDQLPGGTTPPKVLLFDYTRPDVSRSMQNPYYYNTESDDANWQGKPENFDWDLIKKDVMIYNIVNKRLKEVGVAGLEKMYACILPNTVKYAIVGAGGITENGLSVILENSSQPDGKLFLRLGNSAINAQSFYKMDQTDQKLQLEQHLKLDRFKKT